MAGDSIVYKALHESSFDGKTLVFKSKKLEAQVQFEFSFLQYLGDNLTKEKLAFSNKSKWVELTIHNNEIELSDYFEESNRPSVQSLFNLSKEDLIYWIIIDDFENLKRISLNVQDKYFSNLVEHRSKFETCCAEDIRRGELFL